MFPEADCVSELDQVALLVRQVRLVEYEVSRLGQNVFGPTAGVRLLMISQGVPLHLRS